MNISAKGISLIKQYEGFSSVVYMCPADKPTIGFGHVLLPGEDFKSLSLKEGTELLHKDLEKFVAGVNSLLKVPVTQEQFDALVSFAFNVGLDIDEDTKAEGLGDSTLLKKLNNFDYIGAAAEFDKWIYVKGKKSQGLINRRKAERKLFETLPWKE